MEPLAAGDPDAVNLTQNRRIAFEEGLMRQIERIAYRRSMGLPWSEALYQLRDSLVGLEDQEFWDGVPESKRKAIESLPEQERRKALEPYKELGWSTHSVRAIRGPNGPIYRPTAEDLSREYRMIMRLLDRKGMLRQERRSSRLPRELVIEE